MVKILDLPGVKKLWEKYGQNIFIFLGLMGVMLIFISEKKPVENAENEHINTDSYVAQLENDLCNILNSIHGAGKVQVMITLESGRETVYAWQEKTSRNEQTTANDTNNNFSQHNTYENEIVTVGASGNKEALVEKTIEPVVQGVIVVCSGGDDIQVVSDITNAVSVVLNIPSNRICVIKMQ